MADETLPKELRNDAAWVARERFTANAPEDDATSTPLAHDVYPEERVSGGPVSWMVKRDEPPSSAPAVAQPAPAGVEPQVDADGLSDRVAIVEHEGRVYVMTHGAYVTESGGALVVKHRKAEVFRKPLDEVALLFLQGLGTSLSLSLASECAKRDVALVVAQPIGPPLGVLNPIDSARAHLRGRQVLRRNDPDVIRAGLRMLAAKVSNQASIVRYFAKYRAKTDTDLYRRLVGASDEMRGLAGRLAQIDARAAGVRGTAMGFEGQAAAMYWSHLASLLPESAHFRGRVTREARDPVNQAINYVYGMLYGEVWRALVKAGLDPYFGIMHGSERDQGSLVFDLIEEFRAPFADRIVVALVARGLKIGASGADSLRARSRRVLARTFIRSWTRKIRWRGRQVSPAGILQHQAGALVKLINGDADYRPFRMRW